MVHRSALFTLVNSDKADDDETFHEILEKQDVSTWINRQNASGSTLLHQACRNNFPEKALLLMRKGTKVEENGLGEMPVSSLVKFLEEDEVETFLETLRAEVDVTDFISKDNVVHPFTLACLRGYWRSALSLHALNLCQSWDQNREIDEILMNLGRGILHVVECPALQPLLEVWSSSTSVEEKEATEQKINTFFSEIRVRVLFIPADETEGSQREELRRVVREWNSANTNRGEQNLRFSNHLDWCSTLVSESIYNKQTSCGINIRSSYQCCYFPPPTTPSTGGATDSLQQPLVKVSLRSPLRRVPLATSLSASEPGETYLTLTFTLGTGRPGLKSIRSTMLVMMVGKRHWS